MLHGRPHAVSRDSVVDAGGMTHRPSTHHAPLSTPDAPGYATPAHDLHGCTLLPMPEPHRRKLTGLKTRAGPEQMVASHHTGLPANEVCRCCSDATLTLWLPRCLSEHSPGPRLPRGAERAAADTAAAAGRQGLFRHRRAGQHRACGSDVGCFCDRSRAANAPKCRRTHEHSGKVGLQCTDDEGLTACAFNSQEQRR